MEKLFEISDEELCNKLNISLDNLKKAFSDPNDIPEDLIIAIKLEQKRHSECADRDEKKKILTKWEELSKRLIRAVSKTELPHFPDIFEKIMPSGGFQNEFYLKWKTIIHAENNKNQRKENLLFKDALEIYKHSPFNTPEQKRSLEIFRGVCKKEIEKNSRLAELKKLREIIPEDTPEWHLLIRKIARASFDH